MFPKVEDSTLQMNSDNAISGRQHLNNATNNTMMATSSIAPPINTEKVIEPNQSHIWKWVSVALAHQNDDSPFHTFGFFFPQE